MTMIRTIEDLVQVLDDNPQWLDAVRARVLTRELIELPQTLARLAGSTDRRFDGVERQFKKVDQRFKEVDRRFDEVDRQFKEVDQRFDKVDQRLDRVENGVGALRDDIAPLKAAHVRNAALREAGMIAEEMGLTLVRTLTLDQTRELERSQDTTGISTGDLKSFRRSDLIMEVTDPEGETCYVAVEISFTVNGRDADRAVRNASFLTRFTGKRSVAAVAGIRRDARIDESITAGDLFWYRLDPSDMEVE